MQEQAIADVAGEAGVVAVGVGLAADDVDEAFSGPLDMSEYCARAMPGDRRACLRENAAGATRDCRFCNPLARKALTDLLGARLRGHLRAHLTSAPASARQPSPVTDSLVCRREGPA